MHRKLSPASGMLVLLAALIAGAGILVACERKPISGQESAPNSFEGAASVILTPDRRFLFATNGGANSVSSFAVDEDGRLTLLDVQPVPRRRFPSERHRQITSLLSFEANALRVALVRP
jgi:hypothetical protein